MFVTWVLIFTVSLVVLVKSSDYFTKYSERIALALGISPFIIGVTLIAFGTSLPELATGIVANARGENTIAVANALGSNAANIFLVLGFIAVAVNILKAERNLINIDLPLLFLSTVILIIILMDKVVTTGEGFILIAAYGVYLLYAVHSRKEAKDAIPAIAEKPLFRPKISLSTILIIIMSIVLIYISAEFTIRAVIEIAGIIGIATSAIAMTAIALGTSLPELTISLRAAMKGKHDIAIGNIVGSNIFNTLIIVGIPALLSPLAVDLMTWEIGVPFLIFATLTFIFSGITRRIYRWEGGMYLLIYILFLLKAFNAF